MSELFLDDLMSDSLFDSEETEEKQELDFGTYKMKITAIKHAVNKNDLPYILVTCKKDSNYVNVPFYFSERAKAYSLEKLVKLCKKLTGEFSFKKNLNLENLCECLEPIIGKTVKVEIFEKEGFTNYKIS